MFWYFVLGLIVGGTLGALITAMVVGGTGGDHEDCV